VTCFACLFALHCTAEITSDDLLAKVAEVGARNRAVGYSSLRQYRIHNYRFSKEAGITVQANYQPLVGKQLSVLSRFGSPTLVQVLEKILNYETNVSTPERTDEYAISPANYRVVIAGEEMLGAQNCWLLELLPRRKTKYLIKGKAWVDQASFQIVHLEGVAAASVSLLVGAPRIVQDFAPLAGIWFPSRTESFSAGVVLGANELEIQYTNYVLNDGPGHPALPLKNSGRVQREDLPPAQCLFDRPHFNVPHLANLVSR
jgi:hypothetical protein